MAILESAKSWNRLLISPKPLSALPFICLLKCWIVKIMNIIISQSTSGCLVVSFMSFAPSKSLSMSKAKVGRLVFHFWLFIFFFFLLKNFFQKIVFENPKPIPEIYSPFLQKLINRMLNKIPGNRIKVSELLEIKEIQEKVKNSTHEKKNS